MANIENINGMMRDYGADLPQDDLFMSNRYASLDRDELDAYVIYLTYRVQRDFYEMCQAIGEIKDMSWEEFVQFTRHNNSTRQTAATVLKKTLQNFCNKGYFNFGVTEAELKLPPDTDSKGNEQFLSAAKLFPDNMGRSIVESILAHAEFVQYKRQLNRGKNYSWEHYIDELIQDKQMWQETRMACIDALLRLDFKPVWQTEIFDTL
jgi:hypothetical protein